MCFKEKLKNKVSKNLKKSKQTMEKMLKKHERWGRGGSGKRN